jgi:glycosyltransferase involved in cell wall biosynthesis
MNRKKRSLTERAWAKADLIANNFVQYLARRRALKPTTPWEVWAHYKLGKYKTVFENTIETVHWRSMYAEAVSSAACGDIEHCRRSVENLIRIAGLGERTKSLSRRLAAFTPHIALELVDGNRADICFRAALLAKCCETDKAKELVGSIPPYTTSKSDSREIHLLRMSLIDDNPKAQLASLNEFISSYQLENVALIDNTAPLRPSNISSRPTDLMNKGPIVSVVLTTFNDSTRITSAINSLLQQSYQNIEIVVVDDASTDDTQETVERLSVEEPKIKYIRMPVNVGPYAAKSAGYAISTGELITCHDSDDWSHPRKIEYQVYPLVTNINVVATTSKWIRISEAGATYARSTYPLMRLNPSSLMMRRRVMESWIGFWDCVRTGADSELIARIRSIFGSSSVFSVNKPLSLGAHRSGSLMTAKKTGMDTGAIRRDRLDYWEAWSDWHIEQTVIGRRPYSPLFNTYREYWIPEDLVISESDIEACKYTVNMFTRGKSGK